MNPMMALLLANGLFDLGLKIYAAMQNDPATPEDLKEQLAITADEIRKSRDAVLAYEPKQIP